MPSFYSSTFIILLCFIGTVNPAPLSNELSSAGNDLSSDSTSQRAIQSGNDVTLISRGAVELILTERTLIVDVNIKSCIGKILFCYDSSKTQDAAQEPCVNFNGLCGFQLIGTKDEIKSTQISFKKSLLEDCKPIQMQYPSTKYCGIPALSCNPKIDEDGKIKIEVVDTECSVSIKNAKIYVPPISTSSTSSSPNSDSASNAGLQWYHWILIVLGVLLIVFCCIGIWSFFWKKNVLSLCKKTAAKPAPVESIVSTTVTKEIKTITKEEEKLKEEKRKEKSKAKTPKPPTEPTLKPKLPAPASASKPKETPKTFLPMKEVEKEKKKSKTKTPSTESYSAPFCLLPFPAQSFDPEPEPVKEDPAQKRRRNAEFPRRRFADSLEMEAEKREEADKKMLAEFNERRRREKY